MSDRSTSHDAGGEPAGVPFGGSSPFGQGASSDYVPLGDLTLLSSAPLSSEIKASDSAASSPEASEPESSEPESTSDAGRDDSDQLVVEPAVVAEPSSEVSVESLLDDLERVTKERDGYLDDTRRVAAEFANFRRQNDKRQVEVIEQAGASLAERLLPVLDACDGALAHGAADVEPIYNMLIATLEKSGLSVIRPLGEPFDPNRHEAVIHEEGDGDGPHVAEVLRTGYTWKGKVLRPAMVKVRG